MNVKFLCFLVIALLLAGCSRQRNQPTASGAGTTQAAAATAQETDPVAGGNPEPVEQPTPAVPAGSPSQSAQFPSPRAGTLAGSAAANASQPPVSAPPVPPEPASAEGGAAPPYPPNQGPRPQDVHVHPAALTIPANTRFRVRLAETLNTKYSHDGQRFAAYLDEPIVSGDRVVVPKGTRFEGRVVEAKRSGRLKGRAYLGLTLDSFRLHGARYTVVTAPDFRSSSSHKRRNVAAIGGGSGAGAAIGAIAGGGIGAAIGAGAGAVAGTTTAIITGKKDVRLPVETPLVFSLRAPVAVRG